MSRVTFRQHLDKTSTMLIDFNKTLYYNYVADNYKYRITPNSRTVVKDDENLTESEIAKLRIWNKHENSILTTDKILDLFHRCTKVPVWVDQQFMRQGKLLESSTCFVADDLNI